MANRQEAAKQNEQEAAKQNEQNKAQLEEKATQTEQARNETQSKEAVTIDEKKESMGNNAPVVKTESKNTNVIVCLKHPQGIKFKLPNNRSVVIAGNATHLRGQKAPILPSGGFGMTTILKEDWEYIKEQYKTMQIFKSGLIFANADTASASSQAQEHDEIQSGFEPIDIEKEQKVDALKKVKKATKDEK